MTGSRVLLVDDDEDIFVLLRDLLADAVGSWELHWAADFDAGRRRLLNEPFAAALVDVRLGECSGLDLLTVARGDPAAPPIVMLTGFADERTDAGAMAAGAADYLDKDSLTPELLARTLRHAIERAETLGALRASETRYRRLFEGAQDAIFVADDAGRYIDANPAASVLLGVPPADILGRTMFDFVAASDAPPDPTAAWTALLAAGELRGHVRLRNPDGRTRDAEYAATANFASGQHLSILRDVTDQVQAAAALRASERRFRGILEQLDLFALITDARGRAVFANDRIVEATGLPRERLLGGAMLELVPEDLRPAQKAALGMILAGGSGHRGWLSEWHTPAGRRIVARWTGTLLHDDRGKVTGLAAIGEDVTAQREAEAARDRLLAAVDQAVEAVLVLDATARVVYANPAFTSATGRAAAEVIGLPPWRFMRGRLACAAYREMLRTLRDGRAWSGDWEHVTADGLPYRAETTVSPVLDASGEVANYIVVARDVTYLRQVESTLAQLSQEQDILTAWLREIQREQPLEVAAQVICERLAALSDIDGALLISFDAGEGATVLATAGSLDMVVRPGSVLPSAHAAALRKRSSSGAWVQAWGAWTGGDEAACAYHQAIEGAGVRGVAYAPVDGEREPLALLAVGNTNEQAEQLLGSRLRAIGEFAAAAAAVLSPALLERREALAARTRVRTALEETCFRPVFQPIVRIGTGDPVGFEALTRFADGTPPDRMFQVARRAGLGLDLEEATLGAAVAAARRLPIGSWLGLNVSGDLALERARLARVLKRRDRPVVLEITEHDSVADYPAVRAAISALGSDVLLAVDDAGAGVANFSHIVELRPDFIKIDASLIRGLDIDLARQALVVSLKHFAKSTGRFVIAEGVETDGERAMLRSLNVRFGQGYLFGPPQDVEVLAAVPPERHMTSRGRSGKRRRAA